MVFLIQNSQNRNSAAIGEAGRTHSRQQSEQCVYGVEHLTDEELEDIEGKNEGRANAVLEARKASEDARHKLRLIDRDA